MCVEQDSYENYLKAFSCVFVCAIYVITLKFSSLLYSILKIMSAPKVLRKLFKEGNEKKLQD